MAVEVVEMAAQASLVARGKHRDRVDRVDRRVYRSEGCLGGGVVVAEKECTNRRKHASMKDGYLWAGSWFPTFPLLDASSRLAYITGGKLDRGHLTSSLEFTQKPPPIY